MGYEARSVSAMSESGGTVSFMDRLHARLSSMGSKVTGFVSQPEPRTIGTFARGKQLLAGNYRFGGHLIQEREASLWQVSPPDALFEAEIHGFTWLDDLAAVGDSRSRKLAQSWLQEWIATFGKGSGTAWTPDLIGRRMIRWINHAVFLMNGADKPSQDLYFQSLAHQASLLSRRWTAAPDGLPRIEALTGLLYAGLSLEGMEKHVRPAMKSLNQECANQIGEDGSIPQRNPEELLEIFTLLTWAAAALNDANRAPLDAHLVAIERIAPTLRALRHADGGLARFHGGGQGMDGRLDHALANAGVRATPREGLAMGFARLTASRTTVIADVSSPPISDASANAHAGSLAFELTSGRRPVIVNCGPGMPFGAAWQKAGRATPSHSTLSIDGVSSVQLSTEAGHDIIKTGLTTGYTAKEGPEATGFEATHNGYEAQFGLTHARQMALSTDGRLVTGEDRLEAQSEEAQDVFARYMDANEMKGVGYSLRFHLHPDVDAQLDMGGTAVSLALKSGEIWVFRAPDAAAIELEPSVYLEKGRLKPRASKQIVLSSRAMEYASQISWNLSKAQDTPSYLRDIDDEDLSPA